MIPKRIHLCWLSGDPLPPLIARCQESWRTHLPGWEWVLWDRQKAATVPSRWVRQAVWLRKWAFAADYIRLHALHDEGGVYLDADVMVNRPLDEFLQCRFFSAVEFHPEVFSLHGGAAMLNERGARIDTKGSVPGAGIQAAVLGSEPGHPFVRECLDWYDKQPFVRRNGTLYTDDIAPSILARVAEARGFVYKDVQQRLDDDMLLLPSSSIASQCAYATATAHAVHCCAGSWRAPSRVPALARLRNFSGLLIR